MREMTAERLRERYEQQMRQRQDWLTEEREKLDQVEDALREMQSIAAPYVATGDKTVVGIIERLSLAAGKLREERLRGIPADPADGKPREWLAKRCDELWDEKLAFGGRRSRWADLIADVEADLRSVRAMPPPAHKPVSIVGTTRSSDVSTAALDLDDLM